MPDSPGHVSERSGDDIDKSIDQDPESAQSPARHRNMDSFTKLKKTLTTRGPKFEPEVVDLTV
jgi:hypothetical protein